MSVGSGPSEDESLLTTFRDDAMGPVNLGYERVYSIGKGQTFRISLSIIVIFTKACPT